MSDLRAAQEALGRLPQSTANPRMIVERVAAGVLGGYVFTWGFTVLCFTLLLSAGMEYGDAYSLTMIIAFLLFLTIFCGSFAAKNRARVWGVLAGGGAVMTGASWLIARSLY